MQIRRVRATESAVRRYIEELWIPYCHELGEIVESEGLAETFEVADELDWHLENLGSSEYNVWIALEDVDEPSARLGRIDATFAGFITTSLEAAPEAFEWPDRVVIGDIYVTEPYRGDGLANELVERAVRVAREEGCSELALDVDVDSERALTYYEKLGFEPARYRMRVPVDEIDLNG